MTVGTAARRAGVKIDTIPALLRIAAGRSYRTLTEETVQ